MRVIVHVVKRKWKWKSGRVSVRLYKYESVREGNSVNKKYLGPLSPDEVLFYLKHGGIRK